MAVSGELHPAVARELVARFNAHWDALEAYAAFPAEVRAERERREAEAREAEQVEKLDAFVEGLWAEHVAKGGRRPWYR
jgi:hypothetical protein